MLIPDKRSKKSIVTKKLIILLLSSVGLIMLWIQINAASKQTVVELDDLIVATVTKGDITREVRAPGTLVPVELNFLAATSSGRVKHIFAEASDALQVGTVIMTLDNPELTQAVDVARYEVAELQANYDVLKQRLHQNILSQRIRVADFNSRLEMAKLKREANEKLAKTSIISRIHYNESILLEKQLEFQHELEVERLQSLAALQQAELQAATTKVDKASRQAKLQQELLDGLQIKATSEGVLQEIPVKVGEQVSVGTTLARTARQDNLKVELRVQESQVKDVAIDQTVVITAGGYTAKGLVRRIDPAVQQGVVIVDVAFVDGMLPGARPDLRVEGVIELEQINNILKLKRPVFTQEFSPHSLFVLNQDGSKAMRKQVQLGRGSLDVIEVVSDLNEGDRVVVSDTSKYSELNVISLKE